MDGAVTSYKYSSSHAYAVSEIISPKPVVGSFIINNGNLAASTRRVTLNNISMGSPSSYMASEDPNFAGAVWQSYSVSPTFDMTSGYGVKTVYFKIKNSDGQSSTKKDTIEYILDTDGDGIPDAWEKQYGLNPQDSSDASKDFDGDGLTNLQEYNLSTNPLSSDTDKDGILDGWEVNHKLNPLMNDSQEDRDHDGWSNLEEFLRMTDPNDPKSFPSAMPWIDLLLSSLP
jgi:hypothetical protein